MISCYECPRKSRKANQGSDCNRRFFKILRYFRQNSLGLRPHGWRQPRCLVDRVQAYGCVEESRVQNERHAQVRGQAIRGHASLSSVLLSAVEAATDHPPAD
eukprot:CAMPEP_0197529838 /NCGR_PEP_ID=MMETSP1318-20131121/29843_1 /TAXON_ID=552666 /ORGANISM="Partenskyella glossopodia, Strain RCC365" /LENGTH=101 /DNA_ID=CAMNT_0043085449 /DNA_START=601 /DNA_END=906 /DNA_ORIENTATION=-